MEPDTRALEELGAAINRATGLLNSIGELYAAEEDRFHGGSAFAAHGVTTAHNLLADASVQLGEVFAAFALHREQTVAWQTERTQLMTELESERAKALTLGDAETVELEDLSSDQEILRWRGSEDSNAGETGAEHQSNEFAESYEALLKRVTDVEVFASQRDPDAASSEQPELLHLVQGLKEELLRIKRVA
jgi:hypothetical protein